MYQVDPSPGMNSFFPPVGRDAVSEITSYLSKISLKTLCEVSKPLHNLITQDTFHNVRSLAGVNTISNDLIRRYQDRVKVSQKNPTFEQAAVECVKKKALLQRDAREEKLSHVELADCTLTQELIDALKASGSDIKSLSFTKVNVPAGQQDAFAAVLSSMPNLESLTISESNCNEVLDCSAMPRLAKLHIRECSLLQHSPILPKGNVFKELDMSGCSALESPPDLTDVTGLEELHLSSCTTLTAAPVIPEGSGLKELHMEGCSALINPPDLRNAMRLEKLTLWGCTRLTAAPVIPPGSPLKVLSMGNCIGLLNPPDLTNAAGVEALNLSNCTALTAAPVIPPRSPLKTLLMTNCTGLVNPPDLTNALVLEIVDLSGCTVLIASPVIPPGSQLKTLLMKHCFQLTTPPNIANAAQLRILNLSGCVLLETIPLVPLGSLLRIIV